MFRKNISSKNIGPLLIIILSLLPLYWWVALKPLSDRFGDTVSSLVSLGQITALVGIIMFSLALVLSARFYIFDHFFGGINRAYLFHHLIGGLSLVLLMFHPVFLLARYLPNALDGAMNFLLPGTWWQKDFGIYSLVLMIGLIFWTIYFRKRYEIWKFGHKFLGVAFIIGGIHSFFIGSDIAQSQSLKIYMISLSTLGLCAFIYRSVANKFFTHEYHYEVINTKAHPQKITEIELAPKGEVMNFTSGQFVFVRFFSKNISKESHPFSIASGHSNKTIKLMIKELGDYTTTLKNLEMGARAMIEGPFGKFSFTEIKNKKQVWIAGGIGVTPFMSMAESLAQSQNNMEIDFYYCTRNEDELVFLKKIIGFSLKNKKIKIVPYCSESQGRLNAQFIKEHSPDLEQKDILICGPVPMMKDLKRQFLELNLLNSQIHTEEFNF